MKTPSILAAMAGMMLAGSLSAAAQEVVAVEETVVTEQTIECKDHYTSSWRDNWYLQLGAGMQVPFVDKSGADYQHHITAIYNAGFGHWFSPYLGFRFSGYYGKIHYDFVNLQTADYANANFDIMWDMLNSISGVNPNRAFSILPYFGVGAGVTWDHTFRGDDPAENANGTGREVMLPVSAGIQLRLRLCKYVDFFADCRAAFMADNFNTVVKGDPIEADVSVIGGLSFTFGGRKFGKYNPCDYVEYINTLNGRVNDLRGELAATAAALAAAEAQLPCPEVTEATTIVQQAPMMASVRFTINSSVISNEEMVNVYNMAQWMKANPGATVVIQGYADRDTGTSNYNMGLSERRCQSVADALVKKYGIDPQRLVLEANGSNVQPYDVNNWNRIVIFTQPE
ncbi:MAG: OmpA family protein [Pseudoflavonifractor sp.]|nr:OmpA family protein [Alloprevotella sp.]MCM1116541.1 OmpA family protein [Pseudoflavonifractor sp.]